MRYIANNFKLTESIRILKSIIRNKHDRKRDGTPNTEKLLLVSISSQIELEYNNYHRNKNNLSHIIPVTYLSANSGDALKSTYESNPIEIRKLRDKYINDIQICPYCSLNAVKQLDHYLPKSKFPEFSLFDMNLVPCCSDCNDAKADSYDGIFNPFFDDFPICRFLKVKISSDSRDKIPKCSIYLDDQDFDGEENVKILDLRKHYETMNLIKSDGSGDYSIKLASEMTRIIRSLRNYYKSIENDFESDEVFDRTMAFLNQELESNREIQGDNSYITALYYAIQDSQEHLLEYFEQIQN